jgi:glycosyltransferase involved in cell wall biosynthesis
MTIPLISVIIPTTCSRSRDLQLKRALKSVIGQGVHGCSVIIVVNGSLVDDVLLNHIASQPGIRICRIADGNLPMARLAGRRAVESPFFCFLDDDDELLEGALQARLDLFAMNNDADIVVTNGYRATANGDELVLRSAISALSADPIGTLLTSNWFVSCAGTFRSSTIGSTPFETCGKYFEWTSIGVALASRGTTFAFTDAPTYRIHDTPSSLSKSAAYCEAEVEVLRDMLTIVPSASARRMVYMKLADATHSRAESALRAGFWKAAWQWHLRTLLERTGLRYLSFTRYFIPPWRYRV